MTDTERHQLVEDHLWLAHFMAAKYARGHRCLEHDDFVAEAVLVLFKAARSFDPVNGFKFSSYAGRAVHRALRIHRSAVLMGFTDRDLSRAIQVGRELPSISHFASSTEDENRPHIDRVPARYDPAAEDRVDHEENEARVALVLRLLSAGRRAVVERHFLDGLSIRALARERGLHPATIHQTVTRSIRQVRRSLLRRARP